MESKPGVAKVNARNDLHAQEHGTDSGIVYPQHCRFALGRASAAPRFGILHHLSESIYSKDNWPWPATINGSLRPQ
jgi:hypothetical protein